MIEKGGVILAWPDDPVNMLPPFPAFDCFNSPNGHSFAFKCLLNDNWLQAFEVGIRTAHPLHLHRFLQDETLCDIGNNPAGNRFRSAAAEHADGEHWCMTPFIVQTLGQNSFATVPVSSHLKLRGTSWLKTKIKIKINGSGANVSAVFKQAAESYEQNNFSPLYKP